MSEKVYLNLLILCGIFSLIIVPTSSDENISKSSDLLLREKRVVNREEGGDVTVRIKDFPYVVQIKKVNRIKCVGSILSHRTVITAATCFVIEVEHYKVFSGLIRANLTKIHNVTAKKTYFSSHPPRSRIADGVALITVEPSFVYSQYINKIDLHDGLLLPNTLATVAGWGYLIGTLRGTKYCDSLRAITVPIIDHQQCKNIYSHYANITDTEICTFHIRRHCGHTDIGAGLVVNNELAGIHLWGGQIVNYNKPDVFLLVQHLEYKNWIRANIV